MADLFSMKSPLMIRFTDGSASIMAEYFKHPEGLVYFDVFWNLQPESSVHLVKGDYKGDGPWKVGDTVITVLGCHGCDADLATQFAEWQTYRQMCDDEYPSRDEINNLARSLGALV